MTKNSASRRVCRLEQVLTSALASALSVALAAAPIARASAARSVDAPSGEDPFAAIGAQIQKGQERFDIADYEGAVKLWSDAYVSLPDGSDSAAFRTMLAYQIATACREAYKVSRDIGYLHKAEHLLAQYVESLGPEDEEARASADEALTELRAEIKEEEKARELERAKSADGLTEIRDKIRAEEERAAKEKAAAEAAAAAADDRSRANERGLQLQIAGGVGLGVGGVLLGVMGYGLARGSSLDEQGNERVGEVGADAMELEELRDQGVRMNQLALGTAISGGVLLLTGAALLTVGSLQRKRAMAFAPAAGPGFAGLTWTGRF